MTAVAILQARDSLEKRIPLLIKIAPDLILAEMEDIAEVALYLVCSYQNLTCVNSATEIPQSLQWKIFQYTFH